MSCSTCGALAWCECQDKARLAGVREDAALAPRAALTKPIGVMSEEAPRVDHVERYWTSPPPEPSKRCLYWRMKIIAGWRGNSRIRGMGYYESAEYFGVYIWEWLHDLSPLLTEVTKR